MRPGCTLFLLLCSALTAIITVHAQTPDTATITPYLLAGAPTFNLSINQFREDFSSQNPSLPPNEFRAIDSSPDKANLTCTTSEINENLYVPTVPERGTLKIKNVQVTWLPIQESKQEVTRAKAQAHMAAVIYTFTPLVTKTQNQKKLQSPLTTGENKRYYTETEGALHYVVADSGEKGLAFAVKLIKLALPGPPEGLNK